MRICSVQTVQRNMMCVCFLRETTFSEFDVDLILLFIESYFILQCTIFFWKNRKKNMVVHGPVHGPTHGQAWVLYTP